MELISRKTSIKYNGKRYVANVPFQLDVKEIPQELVGIVEEYVVVDTTPKQFESTRRKANKNTSNVKEKANKTKQVKKEVVEEKVENKEPNIMDGIDLNDLV